MPPTTQTQDRLARAQQPFSSSRSACGKGKLPVTPTTATTATAASTSGFEAQEEEEEEEEMESNEMWESRQNRYHAAAVLGSWEMLAWYGISGRESLPQTRLALQKKLLEISSPASDVEWNDDYYVEQPTDDTLRQQQEQREGDAPAGSAREGKGGGRAGGGGAGGGSSTGRGARDSRRRR